MKAKDALEQMSKQQVIDLIIWQMFVKGISLDELTARIKDKEKEVVQHVNEHLTGVLKEG